jgi:aminopeptidase YwaD
MLDNLRRIASADQDMRRNTLLTFLRQMDCPFTLYRDRSGGHWPENIVVSFGEENPRLVVGAHYDSVPNSTGANDNGSGVCILLEITRRLLKTPPSIPIDIVFFDLEELEMLGSRAYLRRVSSAGVRAMVNLDICGVGDTVVISTRKYAEEAPFREAIQRVEQSGFSAMQVIEEMPPSDDVTFEYNRIPALSVSTMPREEIELMADFSVAINRTNMPPGWPPVLDTMHNRKRDSLDTVESEAMQLALDWTWRLLQAFQGA